MKSEQAVLPNPCLEEEEEELKKKGFHGLRLTRETDVWTESKVRGVGKRMTQWHAFTNPGN
jgi:hypothetical protein